MMPQSDARYEFIMPENALCDDMAVITNVEAVHAGSNATNHHRQHVPVSVRVYCPTTAYSAYAGDSSALLSQTAATTATETAMLQSTHATL